MHPVIPFLKRWLMHVVVTLSDYLLANHSVAYFRILVVNSYISNESISDYLTVVLIRRSTYQMCSAVWSH